MLHLRSIDVAIVRATNDRNLRSIFLLDFAVILGGRSLQAQTDTDFVDGLGCVYASLLNLVGFLIVSGILVHDRLIGRVPDCILMVLLCPLSCRYVLRVADYRRLMELLPLSGGPQLDFICRRFSV